MPALSKGSTVAVTGANGFIGAWVCSELLAQGYTVRAVVRDASDDAKYGFLKTLPGAADKLSLSSGNLVPGGYDEAFAGVDGVVHTVAVVEVIDSSDAENKILKPALEGTKIALDAAARARVKRFVVLSSVAAVHSVLGKADDYVFDEKDWNEWSQLDTDAYGFAKAKQERAVWDFVAEAKPSFDAVAVNPTVVLGPCLTKAHTKSSAVLVREVIYNNKMNAYMATFVDVRDVAAGIAAALVRPAAGGERFILVGDEPPMSTMDLAPIAQAALPQYKMSTSAKVGPWAVWLLARIGYATVFQEAVATRAIAFSGAKAKEVLGVAPRPLRDTVKATAASMIDGGWVKSKKKA